MSSCSHIAVKLADNIENQKKPEVPFVATQQGQRAAIPMLDQLLNHLVGAAEQWKRNSQVIHTHLSHLTSQPVQKAPTVHITESHPGNPD